jgi:hypothetical protein
MFAEMFIACWVAALMLNETEELLAKYAMLNRSTRTEVAGWQ